MTTPASPDTADGRSAAPDRRRREALLVFVAFAALWLVLTKTYATSWSELTRMAAIESLVERGTWIIEDSPLEELTWDKVFYRGHFYSDKPPLLQALAAIPYAVLHHAFGITLSGGECPVRATCGYAWLTFLVAGLPSAALLGLFYWTVSRWLPSVAWAAFATACLAFATPIWPWSLVLNNHLPAAAALFASFALILPDQPASARRLFVAGLLGGLGVSFDLPAAVPALGLGALVAGRGARAVAVFAAGAALPALATALFDLQVTGSILPPYFLPDGFDYPGSRFPTRFAGHSDLDDVRGYAFKGLVGSRGVFSHSPVLLWGVAGLWVVLRRRGHALRAAAAAVAVGIGIEALYILTLTSGHGGKSYGERFLVAPVPLLFFFAVFALPAPLAGRWRRVGIAALAAAAAVSALSAYQGTVSPWGVSQPVFYLEQRGRAPYLTACSNFTEMPCIEWGRRLRRLRRQMQEGRPAS